MEAEPESPPPGRETVILGLRIAAGTAAIIAAMLIVVACSVPYAIGLGGQDLAIFGFLHHDGVDTVVLALAPAAAALLALAGGIALCLPRWPALRPVIAGGLAVLGVQAGLFFAGYQFCRAQQGSLRPGSAGIVGIVAGVLLLVASGLALAALRTPGPAAPAADPDVASASEPPPDGGREPGPEAS